MKVLGWCSTKETASETFEYVSMGTYSIALGPDTLCTARDRASAQIKLSANHSAFLPISPILAVSRPEVQSWSERNHETLSNTLIQLRDSVQVTAQVVTGTDPNLDTVNETWLRARANRRNVQLKRLSETETYLQSSLLRLPTKGLWFRHKAEKTIMDVTVTRSLAEIVKSNIERVLLERDWAASIVGPLPAYEAAFQMVRRCKTI